ncbi:MAG: hypothetical protein COV72_07055 [Candidatus Omnitrophica bacterium CG11_big_fil_rev_8_21_14_0_20_42_13]|uniref:Pilus assembly protein PilO n=1 Tax=Candidatus Ghiorseimicrobium undicola TaxID=1974746 RepID=A0A2H0LW76_9BACT|nr:MAG: hypothetical protein COV72_07055 [Candidatus Omnitrophica bacterium CG11_big_fil_rev_8_21_14_0_20_42_13]
MLTNQKIDIFVLLKHYKKILPVIIAVALLFAYIKMQEAGEKKIELLQKDIEKETAVNELIDEIKDKEKAFNQYRQKFSEKSSALIMQMISRFAAESQVKIASLSPSRSSSGEVFSRMPFNLKVEGTYHNLGYFISMIESSEDILKVTNFNLSHDIPGTKGKESGQENSLMAVIMLDAIYLMKD